MRLLLHFSGVPEDWFAEKNSQFYQEDEQMKKYLILTIMALVLSLTGCSKKDQDPFEGYRAYSSSKIFHDGEKALAKKQYATASRNFEALDALYPFGPYAEQGQLDIIYAYYMMGDDASAITAADRYVRMYPRGKNVDYAYYMKGIVGFNLGLSWLQKRVGINPATRDNSTLRSCYASFLALSERFPHSRYTPDAIVRMAYIRNLLAGQEVSIAKFYMQRSAYVAAANRASVVVEHYQGSTAVAPALEVMVQSYRKLGLKKMADQSYATLVRNYPNSKETRYLRRS